MWSVGEEVGVTGVTMIWGVEELDAWLAGADE
jgi:hypothetical protein